MAAAALLTVTGTQVVGKEPAAETGFSPPFSGTPEFEYLAPTQVTDQSQLHQPIGRKKADMIARVLGLKKQNTLTEQQYRKFITGGGCGNIPLAASLARLSANILTNTTGNPLAYYRLDSDRDDPDYTVLASYGLFVNRQGFLMIPANTFAPTRQVNQILLPGKYVDTWFNMNGATTSYEQLQNSAYREEAIFGFLAQNDKKSIPDQLVKIDDETYVGMSMAPALWLTNFCLLYTLNPDVAAELPAYWAPIPMEVVSAIQASPDGVVPFSEVARFFPN